jgi:hypothetical protein
MSAERPDPQEPRSFYRPVACLQDGCRADGSQWEFIHGHGGYDPVPEIEVPDAEDV